MKLNNKGWGLSYIIVVIVVVMLILIGVSLEIRNLVKETTKNNSSSSSSKTNYTSSYKNLEDKITDAGLSYASYHKTLIEYSPNYIIVRYNILKEEDHITSLIDPKTGNECDGYVKINNDSSVRGFISCDDYKSREYDDWSN